MNPSLLDRLLALAPLAALVYMIRNHHQERRELHHALAAEREHLRTERRELINRLQFPHMMPTHTQPIRPEDRRAAAQAATQRLSTRADWAQVGTAAPPRFELPSDADDVPAGQE